MGIERTIEKLATKKVIRNANEKRIVRCKETGGRKAQDQACEVEGRGGWNGEALLAEKLPGGADFILLSSAYLGLHRMNSSCKVWAWCLTTAPDSQEHPI